jgi:gluconolactonase
VSLLVREGRFRDLVDPAGSLEKLAGGMEWTEGPVWLPDQQALLWSDIPNDRMMRWSQADGVSVFREPSHKSNGNTLDREGRVVTAEHLTNRVTRTEPDGSVTVLVESYQGKRLDSPNDLVVKSDGTIWFTDPPYGILTDREGKVRESEIGINHVFRLDPATGELYVLAEDFDRPNGIAFSPDESRVYISDTGAPRHLRVYDVVDGVRIANRRVFAELDSGVPDGFRVDEDGRVWTSAGDGIHVFEPDGTLLGKIQVPEKVSNCEFGGPDRRTLFITASTSLYAFPVRVGPARRW